MLHEFKISDMQYWKFENKKDEKKVENYLNQNKVVSYQQSWDDYSKAQIFLYDNDKLVDIIDVKSINY